MNTTLINLIAVAVHILTLVVVYRFGRKRGFLLGYAKGTKHSMDELFTPRFFRHPQLTQRRRSSIATPVQTEERPVINSQRIKEPEA